MGETRNAYKMFVGKSQREGNTWKRRDDNIKRDFGEKVCEDVNHSQLVQDIIKRQASLNTVMILRVPWTPGIFKLAEYWALLNEHPVPWGWLVN